MSNQHEKSDITPVITPDSTMTNESGDIVVDHHQPSSSTDEKKRKIASNYETINVLKDKLNESKRKERIGMTRAAYIKMIFDVTEKVDKQNDELNKVILDTRRLQRDVNNLSGRLERSFTLVENTILKVSLIN